VTVVAVIPARGGSERIPRKNLLPVGGLPLVAHTIRHALAAETVDDVVVSTDDTAIGDVAAAEGARVVMRPSELATAQATSESALLHTLDQLDTEPELVVFLQATSPVRRPGDIDAAIALQRRLDVDTVFSAVRDRALYWRLEQDGPVPANYDVQERRREQDMAPQMRENGSIYVVRTSHLRATGNRLGGTTGVYEMEPWTSVQIDEPEDVELAEWILGRPGYRPEPHWPDPIGLVVFDFDGVMTDNTVWVSESGDELVRCHRGDGWGVARLRDAGVPMLVLSTEAHPVVGHRAAKLGLPCLQGIDDKEAALRSHLAAEGIDPASAVYLGNDVNDLGCFGLVGLPVATADAHPDARAAARLVLSASGGQGAVRELCDRILERIG